MGENTKIEWCHHTFNPWRGCQKVSPGCTHCYAETLSLRNPAVLGEWGPNGTRVVASESYWRQPLFWDRAAARAGERRRVFCLSLGDWLEDRPELTVPRCRLLRLIHLTPNLDWLLLTKRPEGIRDRLTECSSREDQDHGDGGRLGINDGACLAAQWKHGSPMPNVWLGVSVEDRKRAAERIPILVRIPAAVRFLSVEPLLEDLGRLDLAGISWVIVGGESGPGARPMDLEWARSVVEQCREVGVPVFVKQLGSLSVITGTCDDVMLARDGKLRVEPRPDLGGFRVVLRDRKGGEPAEWPPDLRVREFPHPSRERTS